MDFGEVLQAAARQSTSGRNGDNYYKTKFEPPKKEMKSKTLSSNIQKFLAKKEEEERRKAEEARKKRDELLAMRDPKATNKIKKMLKVIKSANKSVLEDAVDNVNTAVTMGGPEQPDEDDYGYVSQEASAFYSKMMEKYKKIPEEDKFSSSKKIVNSDLSGTKDRVRAAILRQQEEEASPHKRKRKPHTQDEENNDNCEDNIKYPEKSDVKIKLKRPPAPPPIDFSQLLKIAEKKQFEPVLIETKKIEKTSNEPERLMTKKQKKEFEEQKAYKEARLRRDKEREINLAVRKDISNSGNQKCDAKSSMNQRLDSCGKPPSNISNLKIPKISEKSNTANHMKNSNTNVSSPKRQFSKKDDALNKKILGREDLKNKQNDYSNKIIKLSEKISEKSKSMIVDRNSKSSSVGKFSKDQSSLHGSVNKNSCNNNTTKHNKTSTSSPQSNNQHLGASSLTVMKMRQNSANTKSVSNGKTPSNQITKEDRRLIPEKNTSKTNVSLSSFKKINPQDKYVNSGKDSKIKSNNNGQIKNISDKTSKEITTVIKGTRPLSADIKGVRQFPPPDNKALRQFPPADIKKPRHIPPSSLGSNKGKVSNKRRITDDDSEYDSSLEDFIDDGPEDSNDVSKYIKEIFGYDKSKYRDMDDDDRHMESNYSQVMREEYISKKIGIMEDLEDMKMEALEKKRKAIKKRQRTS